MLKPFLKGSALYGSATMVSRGIQILLVPIYTRLLVPADYGMMDLVMLIASLARPVLTVEITSGMARVLADRRAPEDRSALASTALWFIVGGAALLVAVSLAAGGTLGPWVLGPGSERIFRLGMVAVAAQLVFTALLEQLRWELRPVAYGVASVLYTLISTAAALFLIVRWERGVGGIFEGQIAGYLVAGVVAFVPLRARYRWVFDRAAWREMIAFSAPLLVSSIFTTVATMADRFVLKVMVGLDAVGVYGIGARVASTVALLLAAFASALEPLILSRYTEADTPRELARLYRIFLVMVLPMFLGLTLYAGEIVRLLSTPEYYGGADVIAPLTLATILAGMTMFTPGMTLRRKTRLLALFMVATGLANLGLAFLLVPVFGVRGAALATLISAAALFTAYLIASQRYYPVPHRVGRLAGAAAITLLTVASAPVVSRAALGTAAAIALKAAILAVASLALLPVLLERHDFRILYDRLMLSADRGAPPDRG